MTAVSSKVVDGLTAIQKEVDKNGPNDKVVKALREIRIVFRDEIKDPLLTKICRLTADHIENNSSFDIDISEEDEDAIENPLHYMLEIMKDAENKYNREEIQAFKQQIIEQR